MLKQIKQEGFNINKSEQTDENSEEITEKIPNLNPEIVESLAVEESTFLITNSDKLLNARVYLFILL